jgi:hypothetical protein
MANSFQHTQCIHCGKDGMYELHPPICYECRCAPPAREAMASDIAYHDYSEKDHDGMRTRWKNFYANVALGEWDPTILPARIRTIANDCLYEEGYYSQSISVARFADQYERHQNEIANLNTEIVALKHDISRSMQTNVEYLNQISKLQQQLDEQEIAMREVDKLKSELRQQKSITDCYVRCANRRYKKIQELNAAIAKQGAIIHDHENTIKVNGEYIELQAGRLINARNHLARIRRHCDIPEVGDSGQRLDP